MIFHTGLACLWFLQMLLVSALVKVAWDGVVKKPHRLPYWSAVKLVVAIQLLVMAAKITTEWHVFL